MLRNKEVSKEIQRKEKLYETNYKKIFEIKRELKEIKPESIQRSNKSLYMKHYRASKAIEKILKEGILSNHFLSNVHKRYNISSLDINATKSNTEGEDDISPRSVSTSNHDLYQKVFTFSDTKKNCDEVYVIDKE